MFVWAKSLQLFSNSFVEHEFICLWHILRSRCWCACSYGHKWSSSWEHFIWRVWSSFRYTKLSVYHFQSGTMLTLFLCFIALPSGASIIISSTVSLGFVSQLEQRLLSMSFMSFICRILSVFFYAEWKMLPFLSEHCCLFYPAFNFFQC